VGEEGGDDSGSTEPFRGGREKSGRSWLPTREDEFRTRKGKRLGGPFSEGGPFCFFEKGRDLMGVLQGGVSS